MSKSQVTPIDDPDFWTRIIDPFTGRARWYILDDNDNIKAVSLLDYITWLRINENRKHVAQTWLNNDTVRVSTVFLNLDHCSIFAKPDEPPVLFETMVFGLPEESELYDYQERYITRAEAVIGHAEIVKRVEDHLVLSV